MSGFNFGSTSRTAKTSAASPPPFLTGKIGDEFFNRDHNEFRILSIVPDLGDGEFAGAFVVTPTALCE